MTNSINLYLNGMGNNVFVPATNNTVVEEKVDDYNFVSKAYDPTIETADEEGVVQEEAKEEEPTPLQNVWSGTKTIIGGTVAGAASIVGGVVKGFWGNAGSMLSGMGKSLVGGLQIISTPIVGLFKGVGSAFNNSVNGIKQIFRGQIFKGVGSIVKGAAGLITEPLKWAWGGVKKVAKGAVKAVKSVGKAVVSAGKAVVKGVASVGKAIGKGIKKIFSGW